MLTQQQYYSDIAYIDIYEGFLKVVPVSVKFWSDKKY